MLHVLKTYFYISLSKKKKLNDAGTRTIYGRLSTKSPLILVKEIKCLRFYTCVILFISTIRTIQVTVIHVRLTFNLYIIMMISDFLFFIYNLMLIKRLIYLICINLFWPKQKILSFVVIISEILRFCSFSQQKNFFYEILM